VGDGAHDLGELFGESDLLLGQVGGEQGPEGGVSLEQLPVEPAGHDRELGSEAVERGLHQGDLLRGHDLVPRAWAKPARLVTPSLV
jgi:hypothetical protein